MNSQAAAPGTAALDQAREQERAAYRAIRVLATAAAAFVVTTTFQASPAPGGHGTAIAVAAALIGFCAATAAVLWPASRHGPRCSWPSCWPLSAARQR